jgi:hypothetical protein
MNLSISFISRTRDRILSIFGFSIKKAKNNRSPFNQLFASVQQQWFFEAYKILHYITALHLK